MRPVAAAGTDGCSVAAAGSGGGTTAAWRAGDDACFGVIAPAGEAWGSGHGGGEAAGDVRAVGHGAGVGVGKGRGGADGANVGAGHESGHAGGAAGEGGAGADGGVGNGDMGCVREGDVYGGQLLAAGQVLVLRGLRVGRKAGSAKGDNGAMIPQSGLPRGITYKRKQASI